MAEVVIRETILSVQNSSNHNFQLAVSQTYLLLFQSGACACASVCILSGFVWTITSIFIHGFQNDMVQLFSMMRRSAIGNICSGRLKVKVTLEGQMIKWA